MNNKNIDFNYNNLLSAASGTKAISVQGNLFNNSTIGTEGISNENNSGATIGPATKGAIEIHEQDWQIDRRNFYTAPGEYKFGFLCDFLYDRTLGLFAQNQTNFAIISGMQPEYAKLYGDFSAGMLLESALTIFISGLKSVSNLNKGYTAGDDIFAGSGFGNTVEGGNNSREIILNVEKSYSSARNTLITELDNTGVFVNGSKAYIGRLESSYGYNKQIGRQSLNNKVRWRLDYDDELGVHYNIENFTTGKGANSVKKVIPIDISYDEYKSIIDSWNNCIV